MNPNNTFKYRTEIDGLRAVAVVPVILFHAGFSWFGGGFIGVDIFFVISGYLITGIMISALHTGDFRLTDFYERRARRILPALFVMMACCVPFAWVWMTPNQLKDFSQSLAAVSLFASNFLFWQESGYFSTNAAEKPLLHTWSLAVEEQFYIFFPLTLTLLWRVGVATAFWAICATACASLALSEWGWRTAAEANFYLAPTRAWELLAGAMAAFLALRHGIRSSNALASIGLLAVFISIVAYSEETPFPSVYALVPVTGVVLILLFGDAGTIVGRLLQNRWFTSIGLASYSAYLWHQPLFSFAKIYTLGQISIQLTFALLGILGILTFLSWRFIETPFRNRTKMKARTVVLVMGAAAACFAVAGTMGSHLNGFPSRLGPEAVVISRAISDWHHPGDLKPANLQGLHVLDRGKSIDVLFFGDSHAEQFAPIAKQLHSQLDVNVGFLTDRGCIPIPNVLEESLPHCPSMFNKLAHVLQRNPQMHTIIIAGCFNCYFWEWSKIRNGKPRYEYYIETDGRKLYFYKDEVTFPPISGPLRIGIFHL